MAVYTTLRYGSKGDDVKSLQQQLNALGYGLAEDGVYGAKTQAAIQDYQSKNGLSVDGIAGDQTRNSLGGAGSAAGAAGYTSGSMLTKYESSLPEYNESDMLKQLRKTLSDYEAKKPDGYTPSQAVQDAASILKQYEAAKPGDYTSNYADKIDGLLNDILNRKDFEYNFVGDPIYQQYRDKYIQQGKMAMQDTMGEAAALSGGYGNSYAQTVGQQAYDRNLQNLNDIIPQLRDAAYQMYNDEQNRMVSDLDMLRGLEESDYGRYRDTVTDYYADLDRALNRYDTEYNRDYGQYRDQLADWRDDLNYYYNKTGDMSADEYQKYLNNLNSWKEERDYWWNRKQYDDAMAAAALSASSGRGGGPRPDKDEDDEQPKTPNAINAPSVTSPTGRNWYQSGQGAQNYVYNSLPDAFKGPSKGLSAATAAKYGLPQQSPKVVSSSGLGTVGKPKSVSTAGSGGSPYSTKPKTKTPAKTPKKNRRTK